MSDSFYKAPKVLLADTNVSPAAKLVRIVQAHFLSFEGRDATVRELVDATGLSERGVRNILAGRKSTAPARSVAQNTGIESGTEYRKTAQNTGPSCSKSLSVMRDVDKGERRTASPSLSAAREGKEETALALLHLKAREGGGKWTLARWIGQVEEDEAAGRYDRADLAAFVVCRTAITESPWKLASAVRRHAQAAQAAAFRERLRTIRAEGLTGAEGPDGPGRVVYVDPDRPLLVVERRIPPPPGTSYGPQTKRWDVTTPEDLAAWRFRAEQPTLF